nr:hypothetical protein Iba_chr02fCG13930 [Ipomoea batatas]
MKLVELAPDHLCLPRGYLRQVTGVDDDCVGNGLDVDPIEIGPVHLEALSSAALIYRYIPEMDIILRPNTACMLQWRRSHDGESFTPHSTVKVARTGDDSVSGVAVGRAQSPALLLRLQLKEAPHLLLHLGKKRHRNAVVQKLKKAPSLKSRFHLLHGLRVVKIDDGNGFGGQRRVDGGVDPDVGAGKLVGVVEIHGGDPIGRSGHG